MLKRNAVDRRSSSISGCPDMDGFEVIQQLRDAGSAMPIIVLSSRDDEAGKVRALDLGADDYVTKPFGMDELLARIRAACAIACSRRARSRCSRPAISRSIWSGAIVTVRGQEVKLTPREYDILRLLIAHAGKVLTHKFVLREVWGARNRRAILAHLHPHAAAEDRGRSGTAQAHSYRAGCGLSVAIA